MNNNYQSLIVNNTKRTLGYDIDRARSEAREESLKHEHLLQLVPHLDVIINDLARVIASSNPCRLPMTGTSYTHKEHLLWEPAPLGRCLPLVTVPVSNIYWSASTITTDNNDIPQAVTRATVTMPVVSEPSWYTFKRWSSIIIDDFYTAMRALRQTYKIEWRDISKVKTEYSWDNLEFSYSSKKPVWTIELPITPVQERHTDKIIRYCEVRVNVMFRLQIPTPPEQERNAPGCHVVEEEVTTTKTKKIRRMKCD